MMRQRLRGTRVALVAAFALIASSEAAAACRDLTKRLFNVEVGAARSYLSDLPAGLKLSAQHNAGDGGMDLINGTTHSFKVKGASVYWQNGRVYWVIAHIWPKDDADVERALALLLSLANTGFDTNPRLVPRGEYLRCSDGLTTRISRRQTPYGTQGKVVPILTLTVEDSKMKLRLQCQKDPERCKNLPKGYFD